MIPPWRTSAILPAGIVSKIRNNESCGSYARYWLITYKAFGILCKCITLYKRNGKDTGIRDVHFTPKGLGIGPTQKFLTSTGDAGHI